MTVSVSALQVPEARVEAAPASATAVADPAAGPPLPRAMPAHDVPGVGAWPDPWRQREVVVCSFHTPDAYYRGHASALRAQLAALPLRYEVVQVARSADEDWVDATRRKIGFIREVCRRHPTAMVLWIDVDCRITHLPDYVRDSTADLIGFQRSFRSPLHIGYQDRTRFWEPSFWGVNATPAGRKLVEDAYTLEQRSDLRATDDYFLEEAWRANAATLTFQMIPATAVLRPGAGQGDEAFFAFGSSGNVAVFRDTVVQHTGQGTTTTRRKALTTAKQVERALPEPARRPIRRIADTLGVTGALTADTPAGLDPDRTKALHAILAAAMHGDAAGYERADAEFDNRYLANDFERATREAAHAFLEHAVRGSEQTVRLAWWAKPFPGNFGDWLSPLTLAHVAEANLRYHPVTKATKKPHLVAIGSIGRFIRPSSVVVGTGISREDVDLCKKADYVSVRGPLTAQALRRSGGPKVHEFGDPGVLLSRVVPVDRAATNGRIALVRHHSHRRLPVVLPEGVHELSVLMSRPADIERFLTQLAGYDGVITSAMHVMTACQSYGIPCGLVTFRGAEDRVHGSGMKYADYALGADVPTLEPVAVPPDLRRITVGDLLQDVRISERTKDRVEAHLRVAVARVQAAAHERDKRKAARTGASGSRAKDRTGAKGDRRGDGAQRGTSTKAART